jgi:hypothetical protein
MLRNFGPICHQDPQESIVMVGSVSRTKAVEQELNPTAGLGLALVRMHYGSNRIKYVHC